MTLDNQSVEGCGVCGALPGAPIVVLQTAAGELVPQSIGAQVAALCGCSAQALLADPASLLNCIHPDDRERVQIAVLGAAQSGRPLDMEFRMLCAVGAAGCGGAGTASEPDRRKPVPERWIRLRADPQPCADGSVRWTGLATHEAAASELELQLREQRQQFFNVARNVPGAVIRYGMHADGSDFVEYMSPGCLSLWELPPSTMVGDPKALWQMVHEDDVPGFLESVRNSAHTLQPWSYRWRITTPSGVVKWLEGLGQPRRTAEGSVLWDSVIYDVSERARAEAERRRSEELYRLLAEHTTDLILVLDRKGTCDYASPSAALLLQVEPEHLVGRSVFDYVFDEDLHMLGRALGDVGGSPAVFRNASGQRYLEGAVRPLPAADGSPHRLLLSARDVTRRIRMEARLRHDATHDPLTGLANRALLEQRLTLALQRQRRDPARRFAVLLLNVDRFKVVNDSLGHRGGDELLMHVSRELLSVIRPTDIAARLSGDEFVILLEDVSGVEEAVGVVHRIDQRLREPVAIQGRTVHPVASIGIVMSGPAYEACSALLRDADIAMYRCKADPNSRYTIFDPQMHESVIERLQLEADLRRAVREHELSVHYQPIADIHTGRTVAAEALVRWHRRDHVPVPPHHFIPLAEESGLIVELDDWVLGEALQQMRRWRRELGHDAPRYVSVNLSAVDLRHPRLIEKLSAALAAAEVEPTALQLEITESMFIGDFEAVEGSLRQLVAMGVRISLDDFGTGFSSLSYLHRLSVQCIKADRSFVLAAESEPVAQSILKSLCVLSESLSMQLIAEGVETDDQATMLSDLGYALAQGFRYARPMPAEQFLAYLRQAPQAGPNRAALG